MFFDISDMAEERILADMCEIIEAKELGSKVPEDAAKYHLFKFLYEHKNEGKEAIGTVKQSKIQCHLANPK